MVHVYVANEKELPISPVSLKSAKKSRKARHSPYSRPTLPTPFSPSEAEYEPLLVGSVKFSNLKTGFANPIDLTMEDDTTPQESPTFSTTEKMEMEYVIPMQLAMRDETPMEECARFSTAEKEIQEPELGVTATREDTAAHEAQDFSSMENLPEDSEAVDTTVIKGPETQNNSSFEKYEAQLPTIPEISPPPDTPLSYGDLVVVDYAEKKKSYKWPAIVSLNLHLSDKKIVPPGHMTDNMLDLPPEDDDTAIGVRWIEPAPS